MPRKVYSIQRLFVVVTVSAVIVAALLFVTRSYRYQLAVSRDLKQQGAAWTVFNGIDEIRVGFNQNLETDDIHKYAGKIVAVENKLFTVTNQHVKRLNQLGALESLMFVSCNLERLDLGQLGHFKQLDFLVFWKTKLSEEQTQALEQLKNTVQISFISAGITQEEIERLKSALPNTKIVQAKKP